MIIQISIALVYFLLVLFMFNKVSRVPSTLVTSVGRIKVFVESDCAKSPIAVTCLFITSKSIAGCPFFEIASANNLVCSASALAFTLIA